MEYESFYENKILNKNMLEESEKLESEGLLEDSEDIFEPKESVDILKDLKDILEELDPKDILEKPETHTEFSNEAYADLMVLVT